MRQFWRECTCCTEGKPNYFVDNVFKINGTYYLLEVKLNIHLERDLHGQHRQYVFADHLFLDQGMTRKITDFERNFMYVIDTNVFYRYDAATDTLTELIRLDDVHCMDDIKKIF